MKSYVKNNAYSEGLIVEGYSNHNSCIFCSMYFYNDETSFNRLERNNDGYEGEQIEGLFIFQQRVRCFEELIHDKISLNEWAKIRWYVLNNCD